ncbi:hexosaminidase [Rubritalea squalenifaciens DSM 18772]|uniref:Hexosaminidase n=1 Tax=Rubritalea squalenifaciens DSM 18772 TaxID=1123071 RepID=A0A1M6PMI3_9BACT|nr:glycoside hydrolase family 20 protein [Rubritalea squalenifaciens]SHK09132.1 hexosaminidase [Rubritalea squalenifaciens DSM 18772]
MSLVSVCGVSAGYSQNLEVVPAVSSWKPAQGALKLGEMRWSLSDSGSMQLLVSVLEGEGVWGDQVGVPETAKGGVHFKWDKGIAGEESYRVTIGDGVLVEASSYAGLFYGSRTVLQLVHSYQGNIPKGIIQDKPVYQVRSLMIDVGRKHLEFEDLKDWVRLMGWMKFNQLQLHLNDNSWGRYPGYRLESKVYPGLASKDGHYTFEQIREIQDFAKGYGVEIIPEIDSPGHSLAFTVYRPDLAHPDIDRAGFGLAYLDIRGEQPRRFMEKLFDEVAPLFDSKEFHIGTDEYRLNLIKDKNERDALGEDFRLYINHFNKYLKEKHGKTVRIWSGYEHMPGTTEPEKDVIIDMWVTGDAKNKTKDGYKIINSSHNYTYIVPGAPYYGVHNPGIYNDWTPLKFMNKPEGILEEGEKNLLGAKLHIWNDYGPTGYTWNEIARLTVPSMAAFGEKMWGVKGAENYDAFVKYADTLSSAAPAVTLLTRDATKEEMVWSLENQSEMIGNSSISMNAAAQNLEYPWIASFTITRKNDIAGDELLVSSSLAAFYLDLTHEFKSKQGVETKRGVACVRANQAPGFDPLTSYNPDVIVFPYEVPLNQKVTLTFVGEQKKTSLYVDGKLVSSVNTQMVCPLGQIGADQLPRGFHGTLHKVNIFSKSINHEIGHWDTDLLKDGRYPFEVNVLAGAAAVRFEYKRGAHGANLRKVGLWKEGVLVHQYEGDYFVGGSNRDQSFKIPAALKDERDLKIKAEITGEGGSDSFGKVSSGRFF